MKNVMMPLFGALWLLFAGQTVKANPYLRPLDIAHPQPIAGALIDVDLSKSAIGTLLPLVTHSPKDGCILPSLVCEDWSPVAAGLSLNAGKVTFDIGPVFNVLPWFQTAAAAVLPDTWSIKGILAPNQGQQPVTFSAGPMWQYEQATNKGYYKTFCGVALHF